MPGRVLIVAPQIAPESLPWRVVADAARAEGLDAEWLAPVASENALRTRLAGGDVRLVVLVGRGESRGADHATIELASSAGPEPRAVNVRHLAGLLAAAPGLEGVVLVPRDAEGARTRLEGFSARLVDHGARAAMRWHDAIDATRARRWFAAWRDGLDWPALARLDGPGFEHAGALASARAEAGEAASAGRDAAAPAPAPTATAATATVARATAASGTAASAAPPPAPAPPSREDLAERLLASKRSEGREIRTRAFICELYVLTHGHCLAPKARLGSEFRL